MNRNSMQLKQSGRQTPHKHSHTNNKHHKPTHKQHKHRFTTSLCKKQRHIQPHQSQQTPIHSKNTPQHPIVTKKSSFHTKPTRFVLSTLQTFPTFTIPSIPSHAFTTLSQSPIPSQLHQLSTTTFLPIITQQSASIITSSSSSSPSWLTTPNNFTSSSSIQQTKSRLHSFYSHNRSKISQKRNFSSPLTTTIAQMATKHEEVGVTPPTEQQDTIFGKFARGEIPVPKVYEDDKCFVINDLNPQAKRHMLLIPRKPISQISKAEDEDTELLGHLMAVARKVAKQEGLDDSGYRLVVNNGKEGCQSVYHLHIHILGGEQLTGSFA